MNRRDFLRIAGVTMAASPAAYAQTDTLGRLGIPEVAPQHRATILVEGNVLRIDTTTQTAVMEKGVFTSLTNKMTGERLIRDADVAACPALQLLYRNGRRVPVDESKFGSIETRALSEQQAEIVFHSWDADGVITVSVDSATGDILIEPSAYSSRSGVLACRWTLAGIDADLQLVAPFFQGIKLPLNDPLIKDSHWDWPFFWEAGLAILQGRRGGCWVHTQDDRYRYKALQVGTAGDTQRLGFDTQAFGPIDDNRSAGGLTWRLNCFDGDWRTPAAQYRQWLWEAYDLQAEQKRRATWVNDVRFAVSWCPTDNAVLDALAGRLDPQTVLLHIPNWRTDPYDENYPNYQASDQAQAFFRKGSAMGFRMMPHCNAIDMDPAHPTYAALRDFQYRGIEDHDLRGWSWYQGRGLGVPESNQARIQNRDKKVMVKIHPGLSMWRSILGRAILDATDDLQVNSVFIDVTLVSHNLQNCFVEATTPTEGMHKLIRHVASLGSGLVVGGEGLNEITMQGQSFAQAHLFKSWQDSIDGLERTRGCPLNAFLFDGLCQTIGYSNLGGRDANQKLRMDLHLDHGAIPTVTIRSAQEIRQPNDAVESMMVRAGA